MKYLNFLLFLFFISCSGQNEFSYRKIPYKYDYLYKDNAEQRDKVLDVLQNPVNVKYLLPNNYDTSGVVDYTEIFQKAINLNKEVIIPAGLFFVSKKGLTIPSNRKIYFEENAKFQIEKNNFIRYEILRIHDVENVKIFYANILGDRYTHTDIKGEWGFGISIQDSKNIHLYKPIVKDCWGDGIFIGSEGKIVSENITVQGGLVDNNRRNGVSVTSAIGLTLSNIIAANSNGTFPKSGIDLEPSHNWEFMENVNVNNIITYNNEEDGLLIVLVRLKAPNPKKVSININQHDDFYSKYGMAFYMDDKNIEGELPLGSISIRNINYTNNRKGDIRNYSVTPENNIEVNVSNLRSNNKVERIVDGKIVPKNLTFKNIN